MPKEIEGIIDYPSFQNGEYWRERSIELEKLTSKITDTYIKNMEREFRLASISINAKLSRFYQMFADVNNISLQEAQRILNSEELKEFKMTVEEYVRLAEENEIKFDANTAKLLENASLKYRVTRLEAMEIQLQAEAAKLYEKIDKHMYDALAHVYEDRYYRSAFTIFKGFGIGSTFSRLDMKQVRLLLHEPWVKDGQNFSERLWGSHRTRLVSALEDCLTQACILGESYSETAEKLASRLNTSIYNAARLVTTESAYFSAVAQHECWTNLGVKKYEIVATLDTVTSEICQHMDGKTFLLSDYRPGVTANPFHVNCRSTTAPAFDDRELPGYIPMKRAARGKDGKTYLVPGDETYSVWKKKNHIKTKY